MGKGIGGLINLFTEYTPQRVDTSNILFFQVKDIKTLEDSFGINPTFFNPEIAYDFRIIEGNVTDRMLCNRSEYYDREELQRIFSELNRSPSLDGLPKVVYVQEKGPAIEWKTTSERRVYA